MNDMKKTSVYLTDEDRVRLQRLAERTGHSQAWVLREALAVYEARQPDRNFEIFELEPNPAGPVPPEGLSGQAYQDWLEKVYEEGFIAEFDAELKQ